MELDLVLRELEKISKKLFTKFNVITSWGKKYQEILVREIATQNNMCDGTLAFY